MRLLLIHADYIEYAALKPAVKEPETIDNVGKVERVEECLVAFCSAEKSDEQDPKEIARLASDAILEHVRMVKAERVVIYPYAHLSPELASPRPSPY